MCVYLFVLFVSAQAGPAVGESYNSLLLLRLLWILLLFFFLLVVVVRCLLVCFVCYCKCRRFEQGVVQQKMVNSSWSLQVLGKMATLGFRI